MLAVVEVINIVQDRKRFCSSGICNGISENVPR